MKNITKQDIEALIFALIETIDPLVTYEEAAQILNKSVHAVYCKVSRHKIPVVHQRKLIKYSDVIKIRDRAF